MPTDHHLRVSRTARIVTRGSPEAATWWVLLHGYGQCADDLLENASALPGDDTFVLAPEALSRFYVDRMNEHRSVGASWMTRRDREHEIDDYVAYLDRVVEHFRADADAAPTVRVLGFSQGAATASRWALLGDTPVDTLVLWAGDLAHDLDLHRHAERLRGMDLHLAVGTRDEWIPEDRVEALLQRLAEHEVEVTRHTFDGGHRLDDDLLRALAGSGRTAA
jgi:predicted esterase